MKKLLAIVLAMIMLLSLCACGGKSDDNGKKAPQLSLENLTGKFKSELPAFTLYVTFNSDGTVHVEENYSGSKITYDGNFEVNGDKIVFSNMGYVCPIASGEYDITLSGQTLTINIQYYSGGLKLTYVG